MSKWNAKAPADDSNWFARVYGQEMADIVDKIRAEREARERAERPWRILWRTVWWVWFLARVGIVTYAVYYFVQLLEAVAA